MPIDYEGAIKRANFRITTLKAFEIQVKALPQYGQDLLDALGYFKGGQDLLDALGYFKGLHEAVQNMDDEMVNMLPGGIAHRVSEIGPLVSHLSHILTILDGSGSNARRLESLMEIVKKELP